MLATYNRVVKKEDKLMQEEMNEYTRIYFSRK